jgi:F0F1-type ATP synthase membrane subunit b/b'
MFFILLGLMNQLEAASKSGDHGSILDLKWAAVNFVILAGFLVFKLKKPIATAFSNYSEEVKSLYGHAQEKFKEADLKLKMYEEKLSNIEGQTQKIISEGNQIIAKFESELNAETVKELKKVEVETGDKIESEKSMLITEINNELLDNVLMSVKAKLNKDKSLSDKVNQKMINSLSLGK